VDQDELGITAADLGYDDDDDTDRHQGFREDMLHLPPGSDPFAGDFVSDDEDAPGPFGDMAPVTPQVAPVAPQRHDMAVGEDRIERRGAPRDMKDMGLLVNGMHRTGRASTYDVRWNC
jgi:hypothetical protein